MLPFQDSKSNPLSRTCLHKGIMVIPPSEVVTEAGRGEEGGDVQQAVCQRMSDTGKTPDPYLFCLRSFGLS